MKKLLCAAFAAACLLAIPAVTEARVYRSVWVGPGSRTVVRQRGWGRPVYVAPAPVVVARPVWGPQPVFVQPQPVWVSPQPTWVW